MKALIVDLTQQRVEWATIKDESIHHYLGGRGLGARYLYDHLAPGIDPLGPENILSMWTSPIMAAGSISMVKLCGVTKSPATGTILMSLIGGYFGPELRFAGADALIIQGRSSEPVYILVQDGRAEIRPAGHLWGKTTRQAALALEDELRLERMQVACIGPAGENLVAFAAIMHRGNAMGRGGAGAVMGSKNLKAIVASGHQLPRLAQPERFRQVLKRIGVQYRESEDVRLWGETGTTGSVEVINYHHLFPTKNFQSGFFADYEKVDADVLYKNYVNRRLSCFTCPVRCRREAQVIEGPFTTPPTEGPEYESLWSLSGNCGNNSLEAVILANDLCLEYGLDTMSAGGVLAFAMECFEEGLISTQETGGLELRFGNAEALIEMLKKIGRGENGLAKILGKGSRRAAELIGRGAERFAMQVKGMELPGYEPRGATGMGLGYATSPRGGCHMRSFLGDEVFGGLQKGGRFSYQGKAEMVKAKQDLTAVKDALGFCVLSGATTMEDLADLFAAAMGVECSVTDLLLAGERICNLERLFNLREGFTRAEDRLPQRFVEESIQGADGELHTLDVTQMLDEYYQVRGWNKEGRPEESTLRRLGLAPEGAGLAVL